MDKTLMIYNALEWAQTKLDGQDVIDLATAMGIDEKRHCKGCMGDELHFEDQCVVCGTHNVWTLFDVEVNPWTREVNILPTYNYYSFNIKFNELDEWAAFTHRGIVYDVHFHYDGIFTLEIYPNALSDILKAESLTNKLEIKY